MQLIRCCDLVVSAWFRSLELTCALLLVSSRLTERVPSGEDRATASQRKPGAVLPVITFRGTSDVYDCRPQLQLIPRGNGMGATPLEA